MEDIELSIVTFKYDIPNTYMQCLTLGKNLTTQTKISIYYNYENVKNEKHEIDLVKQYIKQFLDQHDVKFYLKPAIINNSSGWYSQQLLKWYSSYTSECRYQMVLDSKNFLFRDFSVNNIDFNNLPAFGKPITDKWTKETIKHCESLIFEKTGSQRRGQHIDALTPWIWDKHKVREMLDTLWPDMTWCNLSNEELIVSEWLLYVTWIEHTVKYDLTHHLTTGMWGNISNSDAAELSNYFREIEQYKFWTHHRIKNDSRHFKITKKLIKEFNICNKKEYNKWIALRKHYNPKFS